MYTRSDNQFRNYESEFLEQLEQVLQLFFVSVIVFFVNKQSYLNWIRKSKNLRFVVLELVVGTCE